MATLYEISLPSLLSPPTDGQLKSSLFASLSSISQGLFSKPYLQALVADPRHCLYALADIGSQELGNPTVYCIVQVYLEGEIENIESIEDKSRGKESIASAIKYRLRPLRPAPLRGARIQHFFEAENAQQSNPGGILRMMDLLQVVFQGQAALRPPEKDPLIKPRKWEMHYIGVFSELSPEAYARWESYDFSVFFVDYLMYPTEDVTPKMPEWDVSGKIEKELFELRGPSEPPMVWDYSLAGIQRDLFLRFIGCVSKPGFRELDHHLVLRIIKSTSQRLNPTEHGLFGENKWATDAVQTTVKAFINGQDLYFASHVDLQAKEVADDYFKGILPIDLTPREEEVLVLNVLQNRPSYTEEPSACSVMRGVFTKVLSYYGTI